MAKEYNITKASGQCVACQRELPPGEEFVATVRQRPAEGEDEADQLLREDFCTGCWQQADEAVRSNPDVFGVWRSRVPEPKERKKTFVDDELIVNFFERLEGADDPAKVQFRFVLALILMRKKLLVYERSDVAADGQEAWTVHLKGSEARCKVIDPHLDEDRIAEVSQQLGAVLEGEL